MAAEEHGGLLSCVLFDDEQNKRISGVHHFFPTPRKWPLSFEGGKQHIPIPATPSFNGFIP
jgi:hypothetical protein